MIVDAVKNTVDAAKVKLAQNASKTENAVGNPTASFEPHEFSQAQYHITHGVRKKNPMAQ